MLKLVPDFKEACVRSIGDTPGIVAPKTAPGADDEPTAGWTITPTLTPLGPRKKGERSLVGTAPSERDRWTYFDIDELVDAATDLDVLTWFDTTATKVTATVVGSLLMTGAPLDPIDEMLEWCFATRRAVARRLAEVM